MIKAILTILALIAKPISQLWTDRIDRSKTPDEKLKRAKEQIAKEIIKGDSVGAATRLGEWMSTLRGRERRSRSDIPSAGAKADHHE